MRAAALALVVAALAGPPLAHADTPSAKTLVDSRNNVGVAYDALSGADFDGAGAAFSGAALQQAGVTPGATVSSDGIDFVWPDTTSGQPDNVAAHGQSIAVSALGAPRLGVLAAATADVSAALQLTYVDGLGQTSVEQASITIGRWTAAATSGDVSSTHDVSSDFYVEHSVVPVPLSAGLDAVAVPLDPSRTLVSVGLPDDARLHIFDLSITPAAGGGGQPQPLPVHSTVAALPSGNATGFAPPSVIVIEGQPLDFTNLDPLSPHDVVSVKRGPDYQRLFESEGASLGQTVPVVGVEELPPGTYDFICSIHSMRGTLTVQAAP